MNLLLNLDDNVQKYRFDSSKVTKSKKKNVMLMRKLISFKK